MNIEYADIDGEWEQYQTKDPSQKVTTQCFLYKRYINRAFLLYTKKVFTLDTCKSPSILQRSITVDKPIVAMVNKPTHLQLTVNPRLTPVNASQNHHANRKGLCHVHHE